MRSLRFAALVGTIAAPACVPGGAIYVGPPVVTLEGFVYQYEAQAPAADAEVCAFGTDTLCIATDRRGRYRTAVAETFLLADGTLTLRFRIPGFPSVATVLSGLTVGSTYTTDCAISNRVTLTRASAGCLPIPQR